MPRIFKKSLFINVLTLIILSKLAFSANDEIAATTGNSADTPPSLGSFALPVPQQPGPFLSFGQTIIGKNYLQINYNSYKGFPVSTSNRGSNAGFVFGLTDTTSLYFNYPIESIYSTSPNHFKRGLPDALLQLEHAFYASGNSQHQDQATVVGLITIPLNDRSDLSDRDIREKSISVGYGSPAFFLGTTYNRTAIDWFGFVSPGALLTTAKNHTQLGSQVLYEAGYGRNIISISERFIFFAVMEFEGQYTTKDKVFGKNVPNTGGNTISLAPSLWFSTQRLIVQAGISVPVLQQLNGDQIKLGYSFTGNVSWTFW